METSPPLTTKLAGLRGAEFSLYGLSFAIVGMLYWLSHIFPSHIGTSYIILSFLMTAVSILLWRNPYVSSRYMLIVALTLCIILFPLVPLTSNDSERYLWDGAVLLGGFDPYVHTPNDTPLSALRSIWPTPEEHAQYVTLYPPGALALFSISALGGPDFGIWVWKGLLTLSGCLSLVLLYKLLARRRQLKSFSLFAFSPLFLFEMQAGAHLDIICVLGIIAALYAIEKDKFITAGIIIGLAASVKFLPAVIVGPFLFYLKPRRALGMFLGAAVTWIAIYGLMFGLGYKPLGLLPTFFEKWRGGALLYPLLEALQLPNACFMILLASLAIAGFTFSAWLAKKGRIEVALMLALAVPLLLSPVLFPWYLLVLLPIWVLKPNLTVLVAIALAPLSYVVLNRWLSIGIWSPANWPNYVVLAGILLALCFDVVRLKYKIQ